RYQLAGRTECEQGRGALDACRTRVIQLGRNRHERLIFMSPILSSPTPVARRHFLHDCGVGLGKMSLAALLTEAFGTSASAAIDRANPLAPKAPHFPGKAKRVIHLFMAGAASQLDLVYYKPELAN